MDIGSIYTLYRNYIDSQHHTYQVRATEVIEYKSSKVCYVILYLMWCNLR